jgi:hypothetical protein
LAPRARGGAWYRSMWCEPRRVCAGARIQLPRVSRSRHPSAIGASSFTFTVFRAPSKIARFEALPRVSEYTQRLLTKAPSFVLRSGWLSECTPRSLRSVFSLTPTSVRVLGASRIVMGRSHRTPQDARTYNGSPTRNAVQSARPPRRRGSYILTGFLLKDIYSPWEVLLF